MIGTRKAIAHILHRRAGEGNHAKRGKGGSRPSNLRQRVPVGSIADREQGGGNPLHHPADGPPPPLRGGGYAAALAFAVAGILACAPARAQPSTPTYADQGANWTSDLRRAWYDLDQGSQLIPLAWLRALKQGDGKPFLDGVLARYGFLPNPDRPENKDLPVGFSVAPTGQGDMVGIGCAACHTRQLAVGKTTYRIDGGPAFIDFAPFAADLDAAMARIHNDTDAFKTFAAAVLGDKASDDSAVEILRADLDLWWVRYHAFVEKSLPKDRLWGPSRMDAISLIYNRVAGLDIGPPPTYLLPQNIEVGHAPTRYPFLWNSPRQDITQWTGFAANGNEFYGLTRNLGEEYGVFGTLHPQPTGGTFTLFNRTYLADNSANFTGLKAGENMAGMMGPPAWPFGIDRDLAAKGEVIFQRPAEKGGCAECHGIAPGQQRANAAPTWRTPVVDVGTDRQQWQVVLRKVDTGSLQGASIQGLVPPLGQRDTAIALLRAVVVGAVGQDEEIGPQAQKEYAKTDNPKTRVRDIATDRLGLSLLSTKAALKRAVGLGPPPPPPLVVNGYEARVLQGIWAAPPYLHNGSVPSLTELLKPPAERVATFMVGPEYDPSTVGLAANQPASGFTLTTTGCDDLLSGDSRCGHDYGTRLSADEKRALLEYLKAL